MSNSLSYFKVVITYVSNIPWTWTMESVYRYTDKQITQRDASIGRQCTESARGTRAVHQFAQA